MVAGPPPSPMYRDAVGRFLEVLDGAGAYDDSFTSYVERLNPTLLNYEHTPRLLDVGQRIADGGLKRVLVLMPPRYLKTEHFGRLLPGYVLRRDPTKWVGLASYGARLAAGIAGEARDYYRQADGLLSDDTSAKDHWRTPYGGGMWAAGTDGPILGFGYDVGIIDDPIDPLRVRSRTYQRRFQNWFPSKFLSRQQPGGEAAIVVVMQRLHPNDPIDFLFKREVGDPEEGIEKAPQGWHVVVCDEVKSDEPLADYGGPRGLPPTCTLELDPRATGAVLAPSLMDEEAVAKAQASAGDAVRSSQRQQRPTELAGDFWSEADFVLVKEVPAGLYNVADDWDLAYTKDERNSASARVRSGRLRGPRGRFKIVITGVDWGWWEFPELLTNMQAAPGPANVEAKASGKSAVQALRREGISAREVQVRGGDKLARASDVQPVVTQGRVLVLASVWDDLLKNPRQGLLGVTAEGLANGTGDLDVNDAFVQALNRHTSGKRVAVR